jgi:hypothetical protein
MPVSLGCPARDWGQPQLTPPSASRGAEIAYDTTHDRTIIADYFSTSHGGTLLYDGSTVEFASYWGHYYDHAVAYDQDRQVIVLFGGQGYDGDRTWEWDGATPLPPSAPFGWVERFPVTHPPEMRLQGMCYDTVRQEVLLYGGAGFPSGTYEDLWAWDGVEWSMYTPAVGPPTSHDHVMAFDEARGVAVVYGGYCGGTCSTFTVDETWEWDGTSWTQKFSAVTPGTACSAGITRSAMAYDTREEVCILFGGVMGYCGYSNETWQWDGNEWIQLFPVHSPPNRAEHSMCYDRDRGVVVLFGGFDAVQFLGDIWEF